ncbi:MAG: tetratricopeptide repeat protein [Thermosynechococcaceae cyanobacterium MS004]|nr:tetratricopeptide repeat protein [Thermosynechococcaceae cyanobacterium MS004]
MAKNLLVINHLRDSMQLSWQRGKAAPRFASPVPFEHPFDQKAKDELSWYLEKYLRFPYGIEPEKAARIEQKFQIWGQQLFELIFRGSEEARGYFQEATREGLNQCELCIASDDSEVLNLPWELLYSPLDRNFLAPSLAGMYRSLSNFSVRAEIEGLPQDKLNILLVIARPYGERDIGLQTIARPMLEALQPIRQQVNLKVLRPPSFDELEQELNDHKGFYHIVHFDGHGDFDSTSQGFQHSFGSEGQGVLVFENEDGSPQIITAAQIAQSLTDCSVPIFVLNACKSAKEGSERFSSVATRLVSLGAKGVVAMAYKVQAKAAKHFIGRLYEQLVKGASLDRAVADGRKEILNQRLRPSPKGDLPLADWMVPVLYQQISYAPFMPNIEARKLADLMKSASNVSDKTGAIDLPEESAYGFIGRDYEILSLERAFRQNTVVLLQGMGGVGKTQLAVGYARWLAQTQGRTGGIFFTSFEHGATLSNVINQIGRALMGEKFSQYPFENQRLGVLEYLKANPLLLIWDNFESIAGFPSSSEPLLPTEERESLKQFLKDLGGGESWVLITSRREESWLDCGYAQLNLRGLSQQDAEELAARILQTAGVDRKKLPQEYLELLQLLDGHPLALRVILPCLKTQTTLNLIEALRQGFDTFEELEEEGKEKSLTVSLDYSFSKLSKRTQKHLSFLALFSKRVNTNILTAFSGNSDNILSEFGRTYQAVFGENLQQSDWSELLKEATEAGVLENLDSNIYIIHPALPWYLYRKLTEFCSREQIKELKEKLLLLYNRVIAGWQHQLQSGEVENPTFALILEEPNILQNLHFAEKQKEWNQIQEFLLFLGDSYTRMGRNFEFSSLRKRLLKTIGLRSVEAKAKGQNAFKLWTSLRIDDGLEATQKDDWNTAKMIFQEVLDELISSNELFADMDTVSGCYYNLGYVAENQNSFEESINFYFQALSSWERSGKDNNTALVYHQLGSIEYSHYKRLDKARDYYKKALKIFKKKGDLYNAAFEYFQLGMIEDAQGDLEEAKRYYQQALKEFIHFNDQVQIAKTYNNLGTLAHNEYSFDEAASYYQKAIKIYEDFGYSHKAADVLQNLGNISQELSKFEESILYYEKALENYKKSGHLSLVAIQYWHLGLVSEKRKQLDAAISYYQKAVEIHECHGFLNNADKVYCKLGKIAEEKTELDKAQEYYQKGIRVCENLENQDQLSENWHQINRINYKLAIVAQKKSNYEEAISYLEKLTDILIFDMEDGLENFDKPINKIEKLGEIFNTVGDKKFEAIWLKVTKEKLTQELRTKISSAAARVLQRTRYNTFLFDLGQIVWTNGAMEAFERNNVKPDEYLRRHVTGDWGKYGNYYNIQLTEEEDREGVWAMDDDEKLNCWGVKHDGDITSSYALPDNTEIWITTQGRFYTTIYLPSER